MQCIYTVFFPPLPFRTESYILSVQWADLDLEPIPGHTSFVLLYQRLAVRLRGIVGFGEEHAVIAGGFLFFADAAWLFDSVSYSAPLQVLLLMDGKWTDLGFFGWFGG